MDLPDVDPTAYAWEQLNVESTAWRRPALGPEFPWVLKPKEYRQIFIAGDLTLETPILQSALVTAVISAWTILRLEVPDIAVCPEVNDVSVYLRYDPPRDEASLEALCRRTAFIGYGTKICGLKELREKMISKKGGQDLDSTFLIVHSVIASDDALVTWCQILINVDHRITDGIGARIILGEYLSHLASSLAQPRNLAWDEHYRMQSTRNLSPPWVSILNNSQVISGPEYQKSVAGSKYGLDRLSNNPGLLVLPVVSTNTQEVQTFTLTRAQSAALIQAVKQQLGHRATITHLGHAAMILAMLRSPLMSDISSTSNNVVYSPCWLNGRQYLIPFGNRPNPTKSYIPLCQSYAPIIFGDLQNLVLNYDSSKEEVKAKLLETCMISREQYVKIREKKNMLPEIVALAENGGKKVLLERIKAQHEEISRSPAKPPGAAHPFFLSDGITEQYIDHQYCDMPEKKNKMFTVQDVKFAANAQRNVVVRMSSWRDQISITGEWEGQYYQHDLIQAFLKDVVGIMLSIIEEG